MITNDIVSALMKELKYFFSDKGGNAILNTELNNDFTFTSPLCVLDVRDAGNSGRLIGGVTKYEPDIDFRVYPLEPNAYNSDDGNYSTDLIKIVDLVRQHFSNEIWLTDEMKALMTNYGFRMSYMGTSRDESLASEEGQILGFKHTFSSIAYDFETLGSTDLTTSNQTASGIVIVE